MAIHPTTNVWVTVSLVPSHLFGPGAAAAWVRQVHMSHQWHKGPRFMTLARRYVNTQYYSPGVTKQVDLRREAATRIAQTMIGRLQYDHAFWAAQSRRSPWRPGGSTSRSAATHNRAINAPQLMADLSSSFQSA